MKAQLITNGWWQADLRVLSAPAFLFKVVNVYTLVKVALPPKIILYCCDPFTLLYWTKNALIPTQMLLSSRPRCWLLVALRSIGFCNRVGYFWGSRTGKIEINSLSSLLSRSEIVFYMTKIIANAAIENSNITLHVHAAFSWEKNQEVVHLLCSSLAADPVITSLWQTGCSNYWHFFIRSFVYIDGFVRCQGP